MGVQLFLMVYLVDTTPHNGCLRVLPGSHLQKIPLDDELGMEDPHAHGGRSNWSEEWVRDPDLDDKVQDMVSTYPGAVDVAVRAGDLVVGDSRLYHAAYRNASKDVRKKRSCWGCYSMLDCALSASLASLRNPVVQLRPYVAAAPDLPHHVVHRLGCVWRVSSSSLWQGR